MIQVFFDASVVVAAMLSPTGGSAQLFEYIKKRKIIGITSQTVVEEIISHKDKFRRTKDQIELFVIEAELLVREKIERGDEILYADKVDKDDAHLVAGAKLTKCQYLVTLDKKHLLPSEIRKKFKPLLIVSPKELLTKILDS